MPADCGRLGVPGFFGGLIDRRSGAVAVLELEPERFSAGVGSGGGTAAVRGGSFGMSFVRTLVVGEKVSTREGLDVPGRVLRPALRHCQ